MKSNYLVNQIFVRAYYNNEELPDAIENLVYSASEEESDECTFTVKSSRIDCVDMPYYQDKAEITVIWGYTNTDVIAKRILTILDVAPTFEKGNVTLRVIASEKGRKLKFSSSDKVHSNTSLIGVAKEIADKHGLKAKIQVPSTDAKTPKKENENVDQILYNLRNLGEKITIPNNQPYFKRQFEEIEVTEDLVKLLKEDAIRKRQLDQVSKDLYGVPFSRLTERGPTGLEDYRKKIVLYKVAQMKKYPSVPQANKSDAQILSELGKKETGGPFFAETRDNDLIIKRRNYNQKPYKSYQYKGDEGNFIEFTVDSKNRGHKGGSTNVQFGSWDGLNKRWYEGNANTFNDVVADTLAKYQDMVDKYKDLDKKAPGLILGYKEFTKELGSNKSFISGNIIGTSALSDETRVKKDFKIPIFAIDKIKVLEGKIEALTKISPNKKLVDANNDGIDDAYQQASNIRNLAELNRNRFSAKIIGDTNLWPGMIITILGIGKKYSGNFYIREVEHDLSKDYMVTLRLGRVGNNIKNGEDSVSTEESGKKLNTQIGDGKSTGVPKSNVVEINKR